jgi:hypothetical protein
MADGAANGPLLRHRGRMRYQKVMGHATIADDHRSQTDQDRLTCKTLQDEIARSLPEAERKVCPARRVWFLEGNPIVGHSRLKAGIRVLFWSGQSFPTPALQASGTFKATGKRYAPLSDVDRALLRIWLADARSIQWDCESIVEQEGRLERLARPPVRDKRTIAAFAPPPFRPTMLPPDPFGPVRPSSTRSGGGSGRPVGVAPQLRQEACSPGAPLPRR